MMLILQAMVSLVVMGMTWGMKSWWQSGQQAKVDIIYRDVETQTWVMVRPEYGLWTVAQLQEECELRRVRDARTKAPMIEVLRKLDDEVLFRPTSWTWVSWRRPP